MILTLVAVLTMFANSQTPMDGHRTEQDVGAGDACPVVTVEAAELPSLNIPRAGHSVFVADGEPVVVGGHTSGFVPTATAEYFADGQWHLLPTVYTHDQGFSLQLRSGKVLIGGGHAEPLGIGQLFSVERYDPATHTFDGFGSLDRKRCFATATETDSGRVVIAGNWYCDDGMELFDGRKHFTDAAVVMQDRSCPYVFRTGDGDVMVFSSMDGHGEPLDTIWVDRLRGKPFRPPLFDEWRPQLILREMHCDDARMGAGTYLFPVENRAGQVAIALAKDTVFSLLPTDHAVPMQCDGHRIVWNNCIVVGKDLPLCAYLAGFCPDSRRLCVLAIGLSTSPATLTLLHTRQLRYFFYANPVLTADGGLLFVGGQDTDADGYPDNFSPHAAALLLKVGSHGGDSRHATLPTAALWLVLVLVAVILAALVFLKVWKSGGGSLKSPMPANEATTDETAKDGNIEAPTATAGGTSGPSPNSIVLMERLRQLMDEQKPYLNPDLKLQDVADMLGTNRTYITNAIKESCGQTFSLFVNTYRVEYAKQLLSRQPDMKMIALATKAGFTTDGSFFRTFKAITGTTPKEWLGKSSTG